MLSTKNWISINSLAPILFCQIEIENEFENIVQ